VWGLGSASKEIHLNGCTFAVRTNLWSCLHYIRKYQQSPSAHCAWRYIWVDAICINQVNTEERNQQVQLMDRIFSQATEVSAWLGEDDSADMSCSLIPVIFIVQVVQQCRNMPCAWYSIVVLCNNFAVGRNTSTMPCQWRAQNT
jgi:hypothetical protein